MVEEVLVKGCFTLSVHSARHYFMDELFKGVKPDLRQVLAFPGLGQFAPVKVSLVFIFDLKQVILYFQVVNQFKCVARIIAVVRVI